MERPRSVAPSAARGLAKKLSFKDKHALEALPKQMETIGAEIARLQNRLADPDLYRRDPVDYATATTRLRQAERDLAASEERWLELELLRETLEAS